MLFVLKRMRGWEKEEIALFAGRAFDCLSSSKDDNNMRAILSDPHRFLKMDNHSYLRSNFKMHLGLFYVLSRFAKLQILTFTLLTEVMTSLPALEKTFALKIKQ